MIYFIANARQTLVKIGKADYLPARLLALRGEHGRRLEVLAVMEGSYPEETALHERFAHIRCKGEWFTADASLLAFIEENGTKWNPDDDKRTLVKIERDLASMARYVAREERISVSDLVSGMLRTQLTREFDKARPKIKGKGD